jgi:hypothetical protein
MAAEQAAIKPTGPCTVDHDGFAWLDAGQFGRVITGRKNIRQHHIIAFFRVPQQYQAIEVAVGDAQILGLTAAVRTHAGKAVCPSGIAGIDGKSEAGQSFLAVLAEAATDVERKANAVTHLDAIDSRPDLDYDSEIFMPQDSAGLHICSSFIHVQVGPTDVSAGDFYQHVGGALNLRVRHFVDLNVTWPYRQVPSCSLLGRCGGLALQLLFSFKKCHGNLTKVERGMASLKKNLLALFKHMLIDELAQFLDGRVVIFVCGIHFLNPGDGFPGLGMFIPRFVHQVFVSSGFTDPGIENLFLDLRMNCEFLAIR